jgi:hypothetical protein
MPRRREEPLTTIVAVRLMFPHETNEQPSKNLLQKICHRMIKSKQIDVTLTFSQFYPVVKGVSQTCE